MFPQTAIFDIDNTLYDLAAAHDAAMEATEACASRLLGVPAEAFRAAYRRAFDWQIGKHSDNAGFHSRAVRCQRALEELRLPLRFAVPVSDFYWDALLERIAAAGPADGATELLDALRARGVRVGVGSDMTADWKLRKLERLGLLQGRAERCARCLQHPGCTGRLCAAGELFRGIHRGRD